VVGRSRIVSNHAHGIRSAPGRPMGLRGLRVNGQPFTITGEYREIARPRLLVFTWLPDWQEGVSTSLVRIDLEEHDGVTTVRVTHSGLDAEALRTGHRGWPQILAWLRVHSERFGKNAVD
jgi:uncharacterized protein YndB with AHSA1/START domain